MITSVNYKIRTTNVVLEFYQQRIDFTMYRISEIKLKTDESKALIPKKIEKKLGKALHGAKISSWNIVKESLDASDKQNIRWVYTVDFDTDSTVQLRLPQGGEEHYEYPKSGTEELKERPIICGFGPAGMFCALALAENGYRPIVIERGKPADERAEDVKSFWESGKLDPESNVQFGEGGAGTFSDGKLTTGIKDIRIKKVLREFVYAGAREEILYRQKPHIGTDVLRSVVKNIRKKIEALGGEVLFETRLDGVELKQITEIKTHSCADKDCGIISAVFLSEPAIKNKNVIAEPESNLLPEIQKDTGRSTKKINTQVLVLAAGHSARDTLRTLYSQGLELEQKPFSIGVRIEHPQSLIDIAQYGKPGKELGLPPAEYKLAHRTEEGRGVYTFCMCPGGEVITASSAEGMTVTNGMSFSARDGKFANSGLLVDVRTSDFGSDEPLAGIDFQEKYEKLAFKNGSAPNKPPQAAWSEFKSRCDAGIRVRNSLPEFAAEAIEKAMPHFAKKLKGFDSDDALLTAVESRSSSPVRIPRDENYESNIKGIYPAGEGAGYAGGIVSAAVDGIRTAEILIRKYKKFERG